MTVYYLISHVNCKDPQLTIYLHPAFTRPQNPCTMTSIYRASLLSVLRAEQGINVQTPSKLQRRSPRRRELYGPTPAAGCRSAPTHTPKAPGCTLRQRWRWVGAMGGVLHVFYIILVFIHELEREEHAKSWQKRVRLASIYLLALSLSLCTGDRLWPLLVI